MEVFSGCWCPGRVSLTCPLCLCVPQAQRLRHAAAQRHQQEVFHQLQAVVPSQDLRTTHVSRPVRPERSVTAGRAGMSLSRGVLTSYVTPKERSLAEPSVSVYSEARRPEARWPELRSLFSLCHTHRVRCSPPPPPPP